MRLIWFGFRGSVRLKETDEALIRSVRHEIIALIRQPFHILYPRARETLYLNAYLPTYCDSLKKTTNKINSSFWFCSNELARREAMKQGTCSHETPEKEALSGSSWTIFQPCRRSFLAPRPRDNLGNTHLWSSSVQLNIFLIFCLSGDPIESIIMLLVLWRRWLTKKLCS